MSTDAIEINFDGLVGPTHNYAGLSYGNLASQKNLNDPSHPLQAALQGLEKMRFLHDLGIVQAVLPPQDRPDVAVLRRLGFSGSDADVLATAAKENPALLASCTSASAMWAANAATVSPSSDTADGRVHFTPANLITQFHRSLEGSQTAATLRAIFADDACFAHHPPLPAAIHFSDEGAANHMRLGLAHGHRCAEVFIFGRSAYSRDAAAPARFPGRQTREACEALARSHGLPAENTLIVQQSPHAIDSGAFHNDVVAVANLDLLLYHEHAFLHRGAVIEQLSQYFARAGGQLTAIMASDRDVPLADAVKSYLFNSQIVQSPSGERLLIAPIESQEIPSSRMFLESLVNNGVIHQLHYVDVRQSMRNGGGPACLRLRVVLNERESARMHSGVKFTETLYAKLTDWVRRRYRNTLTLMDLPDPQLLIDSRTALDELTQILQLGSIYDFQKA